jgi:hypothetical protein
LGFGLGESLLMAASIGSAWEYGCGCEKRIVRSN